MPLLVERSSWNAVGRRHLGHELGLGVGISFGYATLGSMGFEAQVDYGAIGRVVDYARSLAEAASPGSVLVDARTAGGVRGSYELRSESPVALTHGRPPLEAFLVCKELPEGGEIESPLTARELEVLGLLAEGLMNREIADRLVISEKTAIRHVSNIFGKLGASSRTQAVRQASELGLIEMAPLR